MPNKIYKIYLISAFLLMPVFIFADNFSRTEGLFESLLDIVNQILIPLVFSLALLLFFWGMVKYIRSEGVDGKAEGRKIMIWGVIALFVMSCIWGIVYFIGEELGLEGEYDVTVPNINI